MLPSSNSALIELRQRVRRLEQGVHAKEVSVVPFGCSLIDTHLPHGGLDRGALHEVSGAPGIVHESAATLFLAGILARMQGPILWCVKGQDLFAPGLALVGLHPERIIFAEARDEKNLLIVMEEGLHHGGLAAVVGEVSRLSLVASRRLHLAARSSGVMALALYRNHKKEVEEPTAAVTRWRITALPSENLPVEGIGHAYWQVELTRCRDRENAIWTMRACDEKGYLGISSELADRPATDDYRYASAR